MDDTMYPEATVELYRQREALAPAAAAAFKAFGEAVFADGALPSKTKELIAVVLGVAAHCDPCIGFHVKAYVRHGGTKRELAEALGMAVYMGGGPSLMYAANALAAMDEFVAAAVARAAPA